MGTKHPEFFRALTRPFEAQEIRTRKHDGARYITARHVMNRLDEVCGPEGWYATYQGWSDDAVLCKLTITLPDGTALTKIDLGAYSTLASSGGQSDAGDDEKGGTSDALKRAAVQFGIGRHLYDAGTPRYDADGPAPTGPVAGPAPAPPDDGAGDDGPRTGRELFRWLKDQEQQSGVGLLKYVLSWGRLQGYGARIVDWTPDAVRAAHVEAVRRLGTRAPSAPERRPS